MSDSMDEDFERGSGGVSLTLAMIPDAEPQQHAFGPGRGAPNSASAAFGPLTPVVTWARRRGRGSIGTHGHEGKAGEMQEEWDGGNGGMPSGSQARIFASGRQARHAVGNPISHHVGVVRGRESPDSEMSSASGSSDISINGGIKRMRLGEQQQDQQHHFQQPAAAFDPYFTSSSKADSRQSGQGWGGSADVGSAGGMYDTRPQHRSEQNGQGGRLSDGEGGGFESGPVFGNHPGSVIPQQGGHDGSSRGPAVMAGHDHNNNHHPPAASQDRAIADGQLLRSSDPILLSRSSSGSALHEGRFNPHLQRGSDGSGGGGVGRFDEAAAFQTRSASFDTSGVPSFSPFAPQPPAQARYVRGIRVEANAPADVDYLNVNHALKQFHMERRMAAERAVAAAGGQAGGGVTGGNTVRRSYTGGGTGGAAWSGMRRI